MDGVTDLMRGASLVAPAAATRAPEAQGNAQERVHRREDAEADAEAEAEGSPSAAQRPGAERSSGAHRRESEGRAGRARGGGSPREEEEEEEPPPPLRLAPTRLPTVAPRSPCLTLPAGQGAERRGGGGGGGGEIRARVGGARGRRQRETGERRCVPYLLGRE